jgi:hypothetical protein
MLFNYQKAKLKYWRYFFQVRRELVPRTRPEVAEFTASPYKKSDTLFVLASGSSVNGYPQEIWDSLARHDTLALNLWLYHAFVPTYFLFEMPRYADAAALFFQLLEWRIHDYRNTAIIMNDVLAANGRCPGWVARLPWANMQSNFHCLYNTSTRGKTPEQYRRRLRIQTALGVYQPQTRFWHLPKRRASLSSAIVFGLLCGYRRIVLCGVDLTSTAYFYDAPQYQSLPIPVWKAHTQGAVHSTLDKRLDSMTIDVVVCALNEVVLASYGTELYVALNSSGLYPRLPAFFGVK